MTKKSKMIKLIVLIVLLVGSLAAYFVVDKVNKDKAEKKLLESTSESKDAVSIGSVDTTKVVFFSYQFGGTVYEFTKENDTWICSNDSSKELDQDKVNELVNQFKSVTVSRVVEERASDLSQYGLDNPANSIQVTDADGNKTTYLIGNKNEVTNGYYIKLDNQDSVYIISGFPEEFTKTIDDLVKTADTTSGDASTADNSAASDATDASTTTDSSVNTKDTTTQD
jgi:hypothetical protein